MNKSATHILRYVLLSVILFCAPGFVSSGTAQSYDWYKQWGTDSSNSQAILYQLTPVEGGVLTVGTVQGAGGLHLDIGSYDYGGSQRWSLRQMAHRSQYAKVLTGAPYYWLRQFQSINDGLGGAWLWANYETTFVTAEHPFISIRYHINSAGQFESIDTSYWAYGSPTSDGSRSWLFHNGSYGGAPASVIGYVRQNPDLTFADSVTYETDRLATILKGETVPIWSHITEEFAYFLLADDVTGEATIVALTDDDSGGWISMLHEQGPFLPLDATVLTDGDIVVIGRDQSWTTSGFANWTLVRIAPGGSIRYRKRLPDQIQDAFPSTAEFLGDIPSGDILLKLNASGESHLVRLDRQGDLIGSTGPLRADIYYAGTDNAYYTISAPNYFGRVPVSSATSSVSTEESWRSMFLDLY